MSNVSIKNLTEVDGKVSADVTITEIDETTTIHISTNREGEGLWINGQQTLGTSQFSLRCSLAAARSRIARHFNPAR